MIRNLIAAALLALVLAPLVSLHQLGAIEVRASLRIADQAGVPAISLEALVAATRL
ncbi:MAG TPA: hypothetical protein VF605_18650 [Allosphingosinicella sp.]|jgi:hypothetical protein